MALRLGGQRAPGAPDLDQDHVGPKELQLRAVFRVQQRQSSLPSRIAAHELRQPRVGRVPLQRGRLSSQHGCALTAASFSNNQGCGEASRLCSYAILFGGYVLSLTHATSTRVAHICERIGIQEGTCEALGPCRATTASVSCCVEAPLPAMLERRL